MPVPNVVPGRLITATHQNQLIAEVNTHSQEIELLTTPGGGGSGDPFVQWFAGDGPPPVTIIGSKRGDMYLNRLTGELFQLM